MSEETLDLCLIAEGTYPYVAGGVSGVVAQMINGMPDKKIGIFYIGSSAELAQKAVYPVPDHVTHIQKVFLFEGLGPNEKHRHWKANAARSEFYQRLGNFLQQTQNEQRDAAFAQLLDHFSALGDALTFEDFCEDDEAWEVICDAFKRYLPNVSFIDYFYTTRFMMLPLWILFRSLERTPKAHIYHSLCTGYAGVVAVEAARRNNARSIITEHGIYVKERISEISLATWIHEAREAYVTVDSDLGALKRLWIAKFRYLAEYSYRRCDALTTLYGGNRRMQEELGAPLNKSRIIPNGIDLGAFEPAYHRRRERLANAKPNVIGFVGRVVQIKDVKTLLRAMADVSARLPDARLVLMGPTGEEPEYFEECQKMAEQLKITSVIHFAGKQNLREALADIDVMVLTSISEGQPLVILEGFAVGIPCVSADVGSCRSLILGDSDEDRALGPAGDLTKVASPRQTANALVNLLSSPEKVQKYGENGRQRVTRFYQQADILGAYHSLYQEFMPTGASG